ncbi:MAG: hypothetical protein IPM54_38510 [Polyangiaceae bacterium]|nr:hypothetical protein [Polyangiaceae bacterium]
MTQLQSTFITRFISITLIALSQLGAPSLARADLPRPPGWEPSCSIEKEQKSGALCKQCRGYQNPDPCQEALQKDGYTRRCEEGGAGSYVAVWCKGPAPSNSSAAPPSSAAPSATSPEPTPSSTAASAIPAVSATPTPPPVGPTPDNRRGSGMCSIHAIDHAPDANMLALLAAGIGIILVRRRSYRNHG